MLSNKQKIALFKQKSKENFLASLGLEGIPVNKNISNEKVGDLKAKYAR